MKLSKQIKIKYFDESTPKLTRNEKQDWIDLTCAETTSLAQGEFKLIPLGVAMKLPKGYEAHIVPRSSTFKNHKIIQTNHQAVIDETYCGDNDEWKYPVLAMEDTVINKGDRICQFRIVEKMPTVDFIQVQKLEDKDRGGFGSSGR